MNGYAPGLPLRLSHESEPGTRLIIADEAFIRELVTLAPHAGGAMNYRRATKAAAIIAVAIVIVGAILYAVLTLAPQQLALLMPDSWRQRLGDEIAQSFVADAHSCATSGGNAALARLTQRLKEGDGTLPPFTITVFSLPMVNAFALPGGHVVVSGSLIAAATAPDQVAGVIAHELGHVAHRDPEAQLIRAAGLQVIIALFTGGSGGHTLGGLAGTLTLLRYSRDAERAADAYAVNLLTRAKIDPMGLRHFFETMKQQEGKDPLGGLTGILATHPLTDDRINAITSLPPGTAREVLSAEDWASLQRICG
jgi:predicted Zn-dependent protease